MGLDERQKALHKAIETFLHANAYMPERFKRQLIDHKDLPRNILVREGLTEAIRDSSLSVGSFEGLTNSLLDTQDEVDEWLGHLWRYVYEDGPDPYEAMGQ